MLNNRLRVLYLAVLLMSGVMLTGCGGTGGASGSTITLSGLSATTIKAGTSASGVLTIASANAVNEISVDIKTDSTEVTGTADKTNSSGVASFTITAAPTVASTKTIHVWAEYNGLTSNKLEITLSSVADSSTFNFSVGPTAEFSRAVAAGTAATTANIVVSGNQVSFIAADGTKGLPVTISIDQIDNYSVGDNVRINGIDFSGVFPVQTTTLTTNNTDGIALMPTTITVVLPAAPSTVGQSISHVYAVYWRATVTYKGLTYTKTGVTSVTGTTTAS
ncbi:hypothetical protein [Trichlorobacter lovleyi]|uniref:hypothetical protein n=1 Tax=Trichlorobacter lovleyi TaxID=313985 RepID=UPI0023F10E08|nr:hypothetical protein [Trichlorobacter lovleyi]